MKQIFIFTLLLGALCCNPIKSQISSSAKSKQEVCLLINVIDHDYEKIPAEYFRKISSIGYQTIELGNYTKPFSKNLDSIYRDLKFNTLACGASLWELQQTIDTVIARGLALHQQYVICYWPWLVSGENVTLEQCHKSAEIINTLAEKCKKAGLQFVFHNHDIEFKKIDGKLICDYLLELTDPSLVFMEFDIYYAYKTNLDAVAFMQQHADRIKILHLFAMDDKKVNCVGDGMPGFDKIIKKSRKFGIKYLVIEGNHLDDPMQYIEDSYLKMQKLIK